jgi:hypothetical protein
MPLTTMVHSLSMVAVFFVIVNITSANIKLRRNSSWIQPTTFDEEESSTSTMRRPWTVKPRDGPLDPCSKVTQFAKDISLFTQCSISFHSSLCRKCVDEINRVTTSYVALDNIIHDPKIISDINKTTCAETILNDATVHVINDYYTHARSVWIMANCDS